MQEKVQLCQPGSLPSDLRSLSVRSWLIRTVLPFRYACPPLFYEVYVILRSQPFWVPSPGRASTRWESFYPMPCVVSARGSLTGSFPPLPVCPKWAFGPGCSEECRCEQQNTQDCDKRDGSCRCKPGFRGKRCEMGELPRSIHGASPVLLPQPLSP